MQETITRPGNGFFAIVSMNNSLLSKSVKLLSIMVQFRFHFKIFLDTVFEFEDILKKCTSVLGEGGGQKTL